MAQKLKELNENDGDQMDPNDEYGGEGEDDEDQMIDIENLNDKEKAILMQYLQEEYNNNPNQLPMSREVIENFFAEN